jgi:hypothetical protein
VGAGGCKSAEKWQSDDLIGSRNGVFCFANSAKANLMLFGIILFYALNT